MKIKFYQVVNVLKNHWVTLFLLILMMYLAVEARKSQDKFRQFTLINESTNLIVKIDKVVSSSIPNTYLYGSDEKSYQILWADNMSYSPKHMCRFVKKGDSIIKRSNSRNIWIYREGKKYHFVLKRRIWN
ncbi:hypothetical protein EYV94_14035 [Puteibacter caeruleilacunae]|nr:hypothetical protein EYV94_14035 [Puteibacter caeruleilacunae]